MTILKTNMKTCPFCGKYPKLSKTETRYCQLHGEPSKDWQLECCVVRVVFPDKEDVIKHWNKREWTAPLVILDEGQQVAYNYGFQHGLDCAKSVEREKLLEFCAKLYLIIGPQPYDVEAFIDEFLEQEGKGNEKSVG